MSKLRPHGPTIPARRRPIVFFVDDARANVDLATGIMWQAGYDVAASETIARALKLLAGGLSPDIIVLNLDMKDAWDLWDHRQATEELRGVAVVLLSAAKPSHVGDATVLVTPLEPATFLATLQQLAAPHVADER